MFTLKLYLMGLIGLVRVGDGFFFVLPNAHHPHSESDMVHVPVLVCDHNANTKCDVTGGNQWIQVRDALRIEDVGPEPPVALLLNGETLELAGAASGPLKQPPPVDFGILAPFQGACPEDHEEARSLSWLPDLDKIEPKAAFIDPSHLRPHNMDEVVAVMPLLARGKLRGFNFSFLEEGGDNLVHSLTFKQPGTKPLMTRRHASPDVLEVVVEVEAAEAQIHLRPFTGAGAGRTLTIKSLQAGGEAIVLLGNLTPFPKEGEEPPEQKVGSEVGHFRLYYRLSKGKPSTAPLKVPHIGKRTVPARDVNPKPLPEVLNLVSASRSGVERPICTFASFVLPQER